jgi:hypothetical protein
MKVSFGMDGDGSYSLRPPNASSLDRLVLHRLVERDRRMSAAAGTRSARLADPGVRIVVEGRKPERREAKASATDPRRKRPEVREERSHVSLRSIDVAKSTALP